MLRIVFLICLLFAASPAYSSTPLPSDLCKIVGKVAGQESDVALCSFGETPHTGQRLKFTASEAQIYKQVDKKWIQIRDFASWMPQVSQLVFSFEFEADQKNRLTFVKIGFPSEDYPGWSVSPLFVERIDLRSGHTVIRPLKKLLAANADEVKKCFANINVSHEKLGKRAEQVGMDRLAFLYSNLFAIRDYAFIDPEQSEKYLHALDARDWNDGEVAETTATLRVQVTYMKGKVRDLRNIK